MVLSGMPARLAFDGGQGAASINTADRDASPLVQAMCKWFKDGELFRCQVLDSAVIKFVTDHVLL